MRRWYTARSENERENRNTVNGQDTSSTKTTTNVEKENGKVRCFGAGRIELVGSGGVARSLFSSFIWVVGQVGGNGRRKKEGHSRTRSSR